MEKKPKAPDYESELTHRIIGAAIEVHKSLGPGQRSLPTKFA